MPIPIENFETRVRAVLCEDEIALPNELIGSPEYAGSARRFVGGHVDEAALTEGQRPAYESAVIYKTALLLLPHCRRRAVRVKQSPQGKMELFDFDWAAEEARLAGLLGEQLAALDEAYAAALYGGVFAVTNLPGKGAPPWI